jgi:hypothetical protein
MIGDVISGVRFLFEAISSRGSKSREYKKELMNNFIEPLYVQFEIVHKEYVAAFQTYRTLLAQPRPSLTLKHPVFAAMQKDHALSDTDRAKLVGLSQHLDTFRSEVGKQMAKDPAGRLAQGVIEYVTTPAHELTERWDLNLNARRKSLLVNLESICKSDEPDAGKKAAATQLLDNAAEKLQRQYLEITNRYLNLKANLLS